MSDEINEEYIRQDIANELKSRRVMAETPKKCERVIDPTQIQYESDSETLK